MQVCEFQALLNDILVTVMSLIFTQTLSTDGAESDSVEDITGIAQALSVANEIFGA